ncbi:hypothetical protein L198_05778 [Cryptococcus wingfieldii CBS 7118]|uniref:Uncharacterized protein n=1 Tax=Cryptococcus wingfieldii CBS 7118 TaxID=1295528 RepID=A0A1E3IW21_9TREE|nr:hypothetical protein L198_05778 [Cryptococcus wingfieldii CBS 7118]ODN92106.1 hypothetical protein L198_05778 [Cryptococcus wingfieldii CBS 7118]
MPAYVPPHLRKKPTPTTPSSQGTSSTSSFSQDNRSPQSQGRSYNQWSQSGSDSSHPGRSHFASSYYTPRGGRSNGNSWNDSPSRPRNPKLYTQNSPAQLHVFGDSFVGPMKLVNADYVQIKTFKGASAKGLNNPKSIKQVSTELLPILNSLLVPPPYAYQSNRGRSAMLVFGNVDLQINYVWQLANKPIETLSSTYSALSGVKDERPSEPRRTSSSDILASATETSSAGPALGPEDFVRAVAGAYTSWLEREIVNSAIGERLVSLSKRREADPAAATGAGSKILIASALPPLIEDHMLPRIPEKYVERLEEDLGKQHRAVESLNAAGRNTWRGGKGDEWIDGMSSLKVSDDPVTRPEVSPGGSEISTVDSPLPTTASAVSTAPTEPSLYAPSPTSPTKTPITSLLEHDPPLCTLPVRVKMTNHYNSVLSAFCAKYPEIFTFIDITPAMKAGSEAPSVHGEVDRVVWACPVDPTNVHPLWEPTLPLWLAELKKLGIDTDSWEMSEDAEETFKAYEIDKRRRTEKDKNKYSESVAPIKLRDE